MKKDIFSEFQYKAKKLEEHPSEEAWLRLQNKLDNHHFVKKNKRRAIFNMNIYWIAASVIGILCVSTLAITLINNSKNKELASLTKTETINTISSTQTEKIELQKSPVENQETAKVESSKEEKLPQKKAKTIAAVSNSKTLTANSADVTTSVKDEIKSSNNNSDEIVAAPAAPAASTNSSLSELKPILEKVGDMNQKQKTAKNTNFSVKKTASKDFDNNLNSSFIANDLFVGNWFAENNDLYQIIQKGGYKLKINEALISQTNDCSEGVLLFKNNNKTYQFRNLSNGLMELKIFDSSVNNIEKVVLRKNNK